TGTLSVSLCAGGGSIMLRHGGKTSRMLRRRAIQQAEPAGRGTYFTRSQSREIHSSNARPPGEAVMVAHGAIGAPETRAIRTASDAAVPGRSAPKQKPLS